MQVISEAIARRNFNVVKSSRNLYVDKNECITSLFVILYHVVALRSSFFFSIIIDWGGWVAKKV